MENVNLSQLSSEERRKRAFVLSGNEKKHILGGKGTMAAVEIQARGHTGSGEKATGRRRLNDGWSARGAGASQ